MINPCTTENLVNNVLRHPYPYDPTKFLMVRIENNHDENDVIGLMVQPIK